MPLIMSEKSSGLFMLLASFSGFVYFILAITGRVKYDKRLKRIMLFIGLFLSLFIFVVMLISSAKDF
jgi:hypothetical protein